MIRLAILIALSAPALQDPIEFKAICQSPPQVASVIIPKPKPPFKKRHPRIYKGYRCVRYACLMLEPPLRLAANVAQILEYTK